MAVVVMLLIAGCGGREDEVVSTPATSDQPPSLPGAATPPSEEPAEPEPSRSPSATPKPSRPIPTLEATGVAFFANTAGHLRADPAVDGGCLWLEDLTTGEVTAIVWPPGYTARFDPAELIDPGGRVVARDGDVISVGGGLLSHEGSQWCDMGDDQRWFAHEVRTR